MKSPRLLVFGHFSFLFSIIASLTPYTSELCPCDRTPVHCDIGCCCDSGCTIYDRESFKTCLYLREWTSKEKCSIENVLFHNNSLITTNYSLRHKKCSIDSKYGPVNVLYSLQLAVTINETRTLSSIFTDDAFHQKTSLNVIAAPGKLEKNNFEAGRPIFVKFGSGLFGTFQLPSTSESKNCSDILQPQILHNASSTCKRYISADDNGTSCVSIPTHSQYTEGFKVSKFSTKMADFNVTGYNGTATAGDSLMSVNLVSCFYANGTSRPCPTNNPSFDFVTKTCSNVTTEIAFVFTISDAGLVDANVQVVITDNVVLDFDQIFHVRFKQDLTEPVTLIHSSSSVESHVSGSPGYLKGAPVRAGVFKSNSISLMPAIPIPSGIDREQAAGWTHGWWPIFAGGQCQTPAQLGNQILTVRFGVEMRSSCFLQSCHNIVIGETILFVFVGRGRVYKAQNEIIAVYRIYHQGTIEFKCGGRYCAPRNMNLEQAIPIQTIVRFEDASRPPNWQLDYAATDAVDQRIGSLYYPFTVESKASWPTK
ncbi:hypothetical protein D915_008575 [Fasciola hepatica]|uniref:Tectonic-1-3 N-terminal domain-containing protein n=1 Tax=Fasciola hepatica TaxID=6192 RepID=A0A4E0R5A4_FASHE|nr:hypothetical protein D915_008575 [Fasciola hepatica]